MKKLIILIVFVLVCASVSAEYYDKELLRGMTESQIRPFFNMVYSGFEVDRFNDYHFYYLGLNVYDYNLTHFEAYFQTFDYSLSFDMFNWCNSLFGFDTCVYYFIDYTSPIELHAFGYDGVLLSLSYQISYMQERNYLVNKDRIDTIINENNPFE